MKKIIIFLFVIITEVMPQTNFQPEDTVRTKYIIELEKKIAGKENMPAEEVFSNIKIFTGQPAIRVLRVMKFGYSPALGVGCAHCHETDKWESDNKDGKRIARKMVKLLSDVNKQVKDIVGPDAVVNCYTCHRGQIKPALNPSQTK
jgi:hypothetical protein